MAPLSSKKAQILGARGENTFMLLPPCAQLCVQGLTDSLMGVCTSCLLLSHPEILPSQLPECVVSQSPAA